MDLVAVLPLAFVMVAGPQIISAVFLATNPRWGPTSAAYIGGGALSVTLLVTIAYIVGRLTSGGGEDRSGTGETVIDWVILLLVLFLIARVFLTRHTAGPPSWMGRLQGAEPRFAFELGAALMGLFPTDIASASTAGLHVARHGDSWWEVLPFVAVTLFLLGLPALAVLVLGARARRELPKIRDWMNQNSWVISEIVLVFFGVVTVNSLVG